ncbi:MAG: DUF4199 domain-containing protein [Bacteroidia bacterium]|nr:DUF4199 domain-containing protein [Bacteroidia bacterium]
MEEKAPGTARIAIKYGLYTGMASVTFYLILFLTNLYFDLNLLSNVILIVGIAYGMQEFKNYNQGYLRYGQGVGLGLMLSAITGFMVGLLMLIYLSLDSNIIETHKQYLIGIYEQFGYSDEQIDEMVMLLKPNYYFISMVLGYFITGLVLSLIIAAFKRKDEDIFGSDQDDNPA